MRSMQSKVQSAKCIGKRIEQILISALCAMFYALRATHALSIQGKYRNFDLSPIDYAIRPRLRCRLTRRGRT